jgi:hypothetical protein
MIGSIGFTRRPNRSDLISRPLRRVPIFVIRQLYARSIRPTACVRIKPSREQRPNPVTPISIDSPAGGSNQFAVPWQEHLITTEIKA